MPLFRTDGIVLRSWDLGEHDRLISLYTRDLGRLHAVARGARRLRSRFGASLELFTWGEAVGFEREGRALLRLDHFDIRRSFRAVREDLERLGQGARMLEAVTRLTGERDPQPSCFALLLRAVGALEAHPPARVQLAFTLRLLDLAGHRPRLDRCAGCDRAVGTTGVVFDVGAGTVGCGACRLAGALPLAPKTLAVLRGLQAAPWAARLAARVAAPVERDAAAVLDEYLGAVTGSALRSPRFLARTLPPGPA
jgi:DNA repair protein RecO (recombination protein O)